MINLTLNEYVPSEGFKYVTNGIIFTTALSIGKNESIDNWHDTNDEPPAPTPEEEPTADDYEAALERLGVE